MLITTDRVIGSVILIGAPFSATSKNATLEIMQHQIVEY